MQKNQRQELLRLSEKLRVIGSRKIKALIGFDGFVDVIVHVVDKRIDTNHYNRLESMAEYGRRIEKSAGLSTNIEMVTINQKLGGNGPIFANALIRYGFDLTYIGALGMPDIHPVFSEMVSGCRAVSIANPARTDAIEFLDGKIISSKLEAFKDVTWKQIEEKVGTENLAGILENCDLIGFENWTMVNYMSDIWKHLLADVLPGVKKQEKKPVLFFDLADPEKRKEEDVLEALDLIGRFREYFYTVLGLNQKEALEIAEIMGIHPACESLETAARYIYERCNLDILAVHPVKEACAVCGDEFYQVTGPYCEHPKLTTGAGDNFNAGFVMGLVYGLGINEALFMGTATSGYYVRNQKSPGMQDIIQFLNSWAEGRLDN